MTALQPRLVARRIRFRVATSSAGPDETHNNGQNHGPDENTRCNSKPVAHGWSGGGWVTTRPQQPTQKQDLELPIPVAIPNHRPPVGPAADGSPLNHHPRRHPA